MCFIFNHIRSKLLTEVVEMERKTYSLMVVDDHPIVLNGLKTLLASEETLSIDATATTAAEAMKLLETQHPDLVIVDLSLGDSDGTYLVQKIHQQYPKLHILVYSMSEEKVFGERVATAGAQGYVMKTSKPTLLKQAIHAILNGQFFFSGGIKDRIVEKQNGKATAPQSLLDNLSNRELDVFRLIGEGLNTVRIGNRLNISKNTVDTHRINIRKKLTLSNGKALDRMAYEVFMTGKLPK